VTDFVTLPDERQLAFEDLGDPDGSPVLSFHGGLSSRLDATPAHAAAVELGVRLISPDRPGIGRSTFQSHRRLLDWPGDVRALADALGLDQFAVMGWSCGGPYAAVCGARMADRVTAVALLSSSVPLDLFGTRRGLTLDDRILLFLSRWAPRLAAYLMRVTIADATDGLLYKEVLRSFPPVDRTVIRELGSPAQAVAFVKESMRQGTDGTLADYRIFGDPWGFGLEEVTAPVDIWEGVEDRTGPPTYRDFLLRHLPDAQLYVVPNEGHLSLLPHYAGEILGRLVAPRTRAPTLWPDGRSGRRRSCP
jgi:pimeloyl-ACP methyl ester carboxylesterase